MKNAAAPPTHNRIKLRPNERRALLLMGDITMQALALLLALYVWSFFWIGRQFNLEYLRQMPLWFYLQPLLFLLLISGLYEDHRAGSFRETIKGLALAGGLAMGLYLVVYFFFPPSSMPRLGVLFYVLFALTLTISWRLLYRFVFISHQFMRRALLVGGGESGQLLIKTFSPLRPPPFLLVGIVDDSPTLQGQSIEGIPVLGSSQDLLSLIEHHAITDLIVAISGKMKGSMFQTLLSAQEKGIEITRMPVAYERVLHRVPIRILEADWILRSFVDQLPSSPLYELSKRILDIIGALVGLFFTLLATPLIAAAIWLDDGGPIIFTQTRLGKGGVEYTIFKFRTMSKTTAEQPTRVGVWLRRAHLDEIPQFLNILHGEMSLVGPRAEWIELVNEYQQQVPFYRSRLLVKPGLTGWAQVHQSYAANVDETILKLEYDLYYIKRRNLWLDLLILLRTPGQVLGLHGK